MEPNVHLQAYLASEEQDKQRLRDLLKAEQDARQADKHHAEQLRKKEAAEAERLRYNLRYHLDSLKRVKTDYANTWEQLNVSNNDLQRVQEELRNHEAYVLRLKDDHNKEVRRLKDHLTSTINDLNRLKDDHSNEVQRLHTERDAVADAAAKEFRSRITSGIPTPGCHTPPPRADKRPQPSDSGATSGKKSRPNLRQRKKLAAARQAEESGRQGQQSGGQGQQSGGQGQQSGGQQSGAQAEPSGDCASSSSSGSSSGSPSGSESAGAPSAA